MPFARTDSQLSAIRSSTRLSLCCQKNLAWFCRMESFRYAPRRTVRPLNGGGDGHAAELSIARQCRQDLAMSSKSPTFRLSKSQARHVQVFQRDPGYVGRMVSRVEGCLGLMAGSLENEGSFTCGYGAITYDLNFWLAFCSACIESLCGHPIWSGPDLPRRCERRIITCTQLQPGASRRYHRCTSKLVIYWNDF